KADTLLHVALSPRQLSAVEITASRSQGPSENPHMGVLELPLQQLPLLPALLGEVDVVKALQLMPGVSGGNEGTSGLYVRGGGPDQNLILLDGAPLYYVNHLGGFFSVFNADALSQVRLYKGDMPARHGGRLASVLDVRMKEGNRDAYEGAGSIGLLSAKLSFQGPLVRGKSSFILSGRRTYFDLLSRPVSRYVSDGASTTGYAFYDLNGKVNHRFSDEDQVFLSFYVGQDALSGTGRGIAAGDSAAYRLGLGWGNRLAIFRWNHLWGSRLFSNLSTTFSRYRLENAFEERWETRSQGADVGDITAFQYWSQVEDLSLKIDFSWYPRPGHQIRFGAGTTFRRFVPAAFRVQTVRASVAVDTTLGAQAVPGLESAFYVEDDLAIGPRLRANLGLHGLHYVTAGGATFSLQPRLSARYALAERAAVQASFAQAAQFIHLLTSSGLGLPLDVWVPATASVPPQRSWQAAVGLSTVLGASFDLSLEGYYKHMRGLVAYREGTTFFLGGQQAGWESMVEPNGRGEAYGVEVLLRKNQGKLTGWAGYTLSWNWRQFAGINQGNRFPFRYDRRHDASLVLAYRLSERVSLSGTWVFNTGQAITLPSGKHPTALDPLLAIRHFQFQGSPENVVSFGEGNSPGPFFFGEYGSTPFPAYLPYRPAQRDIAHVWGWGHQVYDRGRNAFRMESYHRLDLGVSFTKEKSWGTRTWMLGLYNAYNRLNPYAYFLEEEAFFDPASQETVPRTRLKKLVLFPVIPSVSYQFSF
ncbi:MAG: TonB-dependent receptor, partial [Bacteroidetes bacterium]